jgi:AraC-like DNA-binding protein
MRATQLLRLEASWLLRPLLRRGAPDDRTASVVAACVGRFSSSIDAIRGGAKLRIPRLVAFELLETVATVAAAPDLALQAIGRRPAETLLDYVCTTSDTLDDAVAALVATNRLQNDVPFDLELGARAILRHVFGTDKARQAGEGLAGTLVQRLRDAVGDDWTPLEVRFQHARPVDTAALEEHFRCPIYFGAATFELHIAREDLVRPVRGSDPALHALLRDAANEQLARLPHPKDSATRAVRIALREALPLGTASLDAIAAQLKIGPRTLQRRLDEEGAEFASLVDATRRQLVAELLADGTRTLRDVASHAGFRDVSSLHRAVRRWTGQRPSELRKRPLRSPS